MPLLAPFVIALVGIAATGPIEAPTRVSPPWTGVDLVPADTDFYIHVDDAAGLRRRLAAMPLMDAVRSAFSDEQVTARWTSIAQRLGRTEEQCFDELLGRDVVVAMRRTEQETDWVLVTRIDETTFEHIFARLRGKFVGDGLIDFPCQGLVGAWREPNLIIGPSRTAPLFIGTTAPVRERPPALSTHALLRAARSWAPSGVQVFLRHPDLVAGASVITATLSDRAITMQHLAQFDHMALPSESKEETPLDSSLLSRFEGLAMAGVIRRQCDAPAGAFMTAILPEAQPCEGMRLNAGDRWMLLIGDVDGAPSVSCRVPAVAIAVEVRDSCDGRRQHEAMLRRAAQAFNARYARSFGGEITPPEVAACADIEDPRHCDLSRPLRAASGNHPLVRTCSLHWRAVAGDDGNWQLYSSHRSWLDQVARRLEGTGSSDAPRIIARSPEVVATPTEVPNEGFLHGPAVALMIETWGNSAPEFVASDPDRFREAIALCAAMLRGADRVRWRMERPRAQLLETHMSIDLAPPSAP